jgi:RNA polymerase sigma-70 factor (family 1)
MIKEYKYALQEGGVDTINLKILMESSSEIDNSDLVEMLKLGDKLAFQQIYKRYWNRLFKLASSKVKGTDNAKEIVQDIFLDLWHRRQEVTINDLERYLFSAVKYKVFDYFKKEALRQQYAYAVFLNHNDAEENTEDEIAYNDLFKHMTETLNVMPEKTKTIFELNRIQNKTADEVSSLLGIPKRTVEYHIAQAIKVLRVRLREYMHTVIFLVHLIFY